MSIDWSKEPTRLEHKGAAYPDGIGRTVIVYVHAVREHGSWSVEVYDGPGGFSVRRRLPGGLGFDAVRAEAERLVALLPQVLNP